MMKGAPDSVTVVLLCALVLTVQAGAVKIQKCSHGSVTQQENSTPARFYCDGFTATDNVTWTLVKKNSSGPTVITCMPGSTQCDDTGTSLSVTRNTLTSLLTIHNNYRMWEGNDSITCSAAKQTASCTLNVEAEATMSKCGVTLNATDWTVSGSCRFVRAYSSTDLYTCVWHQQINTQQGSIPITGVVDKMAIDMHQGVYYNGNCTFMTSLSPYQGARRYSYTVTFFPGPDDKPAGSITIQSPGDPVTNCPQYVYEGQSVSCDCLVSSQGYPPATPQWKDKRPGHPLVVDVTRNDTGRVFTCLLTWGPANDSIKNETHYTLDMAYPPPFPPVLSVYNDRSGMTDGNPFTLICTVTGGRPLVTSVNVSCRPDVQGDVSWMNVTNTSVSVTFTILSIEARHDGTECVCTADWEVHRETYNVSASIQLRVMDTFVFPVSIVAGVAGGSVVVIISVVVVVVQVRRRRPVTKPPESDEAALEDDAGTYDDDLERPGMPKDIEEDGCGYATVTEATSHRASSSDYGYAVPDMSVYTQPSGASDRDRKTSTVTEATSHRASSSDYGYAVPDMSVYTQPSGTSDRDRKASTVTVEEGGNLYAEPDVPLSTQLSRASDRNRKASTATVEKGGNLYAEPDVPLSTQLSRASDRNRKASTATVEKGGNLYAEPDVPLSTHPSGAPVKDSRTPTVTLREDGSLYSVMDIVSRVTVSIPSSALESPDDPATHTYAQVDRNAKRSKSTALVFNADRSASSTDVYAQVNKATKRNTTAATEVNKGVGAHEQQPEEIVKPKPTLKPRISVKPKLNK